jgi:fumarate reductase subunit D
MDRAQDSLYSVEHGGAWFMALVAIVLGVVGLLTGLGIIDLRDTAETANVLPGIDVSTNTDAGVSGILENNFWDGTMLLFAAMTAGMLAYCLHANDHHRMRDLSTLPKSEQGLWSGEHTGAYIFAIIAIALTAIGLLTGFGAFGGQDQADGLMWIWLGLASSMLATTLHAVRHHQAVTDEDMIIAIVEERVNMSGTRQPGRQNV